MAKDQDSGVGPRRWTRLTDVEAPLNQRCRKRAGRIIRAIRLQKGLTQGEFASALERVLTREDEGVDVLVDTDYVANLERGEVQKVSRRLILWIAEALRATVWQTALLLDVSEGGGTGYLLEILAGEPPIMPDCGGGLFSDEALADPALLKALLREETELMLIQFQALLPGVIARLQAALAAVERGQIPEDLAETEDKDDGTDS